jgi:hypothetical protein
MSRTTISSLALPGLLFGVGVTVGVACKRVEPNENHCFNNDGNAFCRERHGDDPAFAFCSSGCVAPTPAQDGCVAERPADDCYSPCGDRMTFADDPTCEGVADTSTSGPTTGDGTADTSDSMTTTGPGTATDSGTTGPGPGCTDHPDCTDPALPICEADTCVACDAATDPDAACAEADPSSPVCSEGACVQCTDANPIACDGNTPVCHPDQNTCVACSDHAQCSDSACNLPTGACLPTDNVIHVDGDGGQDATTISAGLTMLGDTDGVLVLHEHAGNYDQSIILSTGATVAIIAAPGESPGWVQTNNGNPTLSVTSSSTALLADLQLTLNGAAQALHLDASSAVLQRCRLTQNSGGGITAAFASELRLENSFVGGPADAEAIAIASSTVTVVASTLVASTFGATAALQCNATSTVHVRNSIMVTQGGTAGTEVSCTLDTDDGNATEAEAGPFPAMTSDWFLNYSQGDLHLNNDGLTDFAGLAIWKTGDPLTDIDGELRSGIDGTPEHAGADLP